MARRQGVRQKQEWQGTISQKAGFVPKQARGSVYPVRASVIQINSRFLLGRRERMFINARLCFFLLVCMFYATTGSAQDLSPTTPADNGMINLDVVVTPKSGPPVGDLQQQDFTILDNKVPQTIASFRAVRGKEAPIEVVLVVDDVNTGITNIAYERSEIGKFLRADGGQLANPIALAFLTDDGIKVQDDF
jgi:hypothetical protein